MSRARLWLAALVTFGLPSAHAQTSGGLPASSPAVSECVRAYERSQEQRKIGRLIEARSTLQQCSQDICPEFIRADCMNWFGEVQAELPTLVFAVRSGGRDLADVRISLGELQLASRVDGQAIELNPGEYDLKFEAPEMQVSTQHFVVARGEHNRLIEVELSPLALAPAPLRLDEPRPEPRPSRSMVLPGVLAGLGVAGLGVFGGVGFWGRSDESKLQLGCAPRCAPQDVAAVKTKYVVADVSLGIGVAALTVATLLLLRDDAEPSQAKLPGVGVRVGASAASLVYAGDFQ